LFFTIILYYLRHEKYKILKTIKNERFTKNWFPKSFSEPGGGEAGFQVPELLRLVNVIPMECSVADPDPGSGAYLTP
jgi:hypothetical protein